MPGRTTGDIPASAITSRPEELRATVSAQQATIAAQQATIDALIAAAEERAETVTHLGTQHLVEERTARLHNGERVLRSVVEALDGALCIVGADGTILDANRRWLHELVPFTHPAGARPTGPGMVGEIGADFFAWCATAADMREILAEAGAIVRRVIVEGCPGEGTIGTTRGLDRSVKGQVGPTGSRRWVVVRIHPVRDHDAARAVVTLIDITEGMRTQDQLARATEEAQRLALVARAAGNAVVITLADGTIEWVNDPFTLRTGYSLQEAVGQSRPSLFHGACLGLEEFADFLARIEDGRASDGEFPMASRQGDRYWAHLEVRPVLEDGRVAHLVWVEQDVTARRLTQQRLQDAMTHAEHLAAELSQEKTLLAGVISAVPQLVFWKDGHGRYVGCNAAYLTFRGLRAETDLLGRDEAALGLDDPLGRTLTALEAQVTATGEAVVDRKVDLSDSNGQLRALLLSVLPLSQDSDGTRGVIGVGADITRARELEHQLAQANRLESIGQLAAGIAHEINTPVQYVSDNIRFIAEATTALLGAAQQLAAVHDPGGDTGGDTGSDTGGDPGSSAGAVESTVGGGWPAVRAILEPLELDFLSEEIPGALAESREGMGVLTEFVRAMKDYAHPGTGRADVDVNRAIESTVQVCRNEWKYQAQVHLDLDPQAGTAPCFEGDLKQVILNMIVNAAQAIGEDLDRGDRTGLGAITVATRRGTDHLVITIADDGPGMQENVRRRVFDPFFTTKEVGKGTGQGLSLAHAVIVTKHQGRIDLDTAPGRGATFTLHLPLHAPDSTDSTDSTDNDASTDGHDPSRRRGDAS